ncbi:MAG: hypothetical protein H8E28_11025 [Anaerolineae bacterium]|nr:hypothetical protein [Anaerolineae bacterium]MBL6965542.1 hypothetical protein [Anaerolineales bacterium]
MRNLKLWKLGGLLLGLVWLITGCDAAPRVDSVQSTPTLEATPEDLPLEMIQAGQVRQWAIGANASSSYADPEWGSEQVVGAPNTARCGDFQTAWSSSGSDSREWLEVEFETPLYVTAVNIVQSFNPNQISKVELLDAFGRMEIIYESAPFQVTQPCPYTLAIPIPRTAQRYTIVRITIDQAILGLGWNQIDAVELVGETE